MTSRGRSPGKGLRGARGRDLVVRLQFFQLKLKLFQLPLQLLALAAEDHPPILLDNQLQMFDPLIARFVLLQKLAVLRNYQRLQCFHIKRIEIRQSSRNHDCSMA